MEARAHRGTFFLIVVSTARAEREADTTTKRLRRLRPANILIIKCCAVVVLCCAADPICSEGVVVTLPARRVVATGGLCTVINSISNIKTTLVLFKVVVVVGIGVGAGSSVGGVLKNIYEVYICTRILFLWIHQPIRLRV